MKQELKTLGSKLRAGNWVILTSRELWLLLGTIGTLLAVGAFFLFRYIEPPPPKVVTISTGAASGAYYQYAQRYAEALKKHGITLKILESKGSVENLARLQDPKQKVDFAFVQTGIVGSEEYPELEALASVAFEPLWVLHKPTKKFERLIDLKGKRINVGPVGSGTNPVALEFLKANGIDATNSTLSNLPTRDSAEALKTDQVDAIMLVSSSSAEVIKDALNDGMQIIEFDHADAYVRRFPWMSKVTLPKGATDFATNKPARDLQLVAANANLVARADTHRAIAFLIMDIASEVHANPGPLHDLRQFPNEKSLQFVQSEESKRFFKTGRPFLQKYLPFWLANLLERLLVSIVPILAIGIPLIKLIPAFIDYRERAAILQLYEEAFRLEHNIDKNLELAKAPAILNDIEHRLDQLRLGAAKHIEFYNLKSHLDLVRSRLQPSVQAK
jgi:TRAP transporter TAXI family solute receptor